MAKTRGEFTAEFKREAVALLESSGRPQMQIAAELGIHTSMLRQGRMADGRVPTAAAGRIDRNRTRESSRIPSDQAAEIARLRRELDRTRMERDVLKNYLGPVPACGRQKRPCLVSSVWRVAAVSLLEAQSPLKNVVHGSLRT